MSNYLNETQLEAYCREINVFTMIINQEDIRSAILNTQRITPNLFDNFIKASKDFCSGNGCAIKMEHDLQQLRNNNILLNSSLILKQKEIDEVSTLMDIEKRLSNKLDIRLEELEKQFRVITDTVDENIKLRKLQSFNDIKQD